MEEEQTIKIDWKDEDGSRKIAVFARLGDEVAAYVSQNGAQEESRTDLCVMAVVGAFVHKRIGFSKLKGLERLYFGR